MLENAALYVWPGRRGFLIPLDSFQTFPDGFFYCLTHLHLGLFVAGFHTFMLSGQFPRARGSFLIPPSTKVQEDRNPENAQSSDQPNTRAATGIPNAKPATLATLSHG
jgi:hypothetical protein